MKKHLIIAGGNGFLGKAILRLASKAGIPVVNISRSGKPRGIGDEEYIGVNWISADVSDTSTWKNYLNNCLAVINCIGIIEENASKGMTYERTIYETDEVLGDMALAAGVKKFVQVSAVKGAPGTPDLYMICKKAAERYLGDIIPQLAIVRPGILYGTDRPETINQADHLKELMLKDSNMRQQMWEVRPMDVTMVAESILKMATDPELNGIFTLDDIEHLVEPDKL
jgi:NADH dehydrogenase